ncbi:PHP-associated domain-containing protein [Methanoregula sp.]|uniref:endonuclease Q family protein n=1 Tax=Methanoregula sp. TaxID=2052170 RepID=UPI002C25C4D9|nr:PHP-associated domain-containing protein [Methanoregula sp.]HVP97173.1 PHP-associated domain-containing protein [Methanoregula sp.]
MLATADLHIHSPYSIAVSRFMQPEELIRGCITKGIQVLGTGDALQPDWLAGWKPLLENDAGIIIVPQAEIEDRNRVHHVILAAEPAQFDQLRDLLTGTSKSFVSSGRPHVYLGGEEIAGLAHDVGALVGPAHAFTPWTAMYAYFDSVPACYGSESIDFVELGLSADSSYGAAIPDLYDLPFLTNSDAHSPTPDKLGREFNRLRLAGRTAKDVLAAIRTRDVAMNAGFFPEEGKYNRTACTRCYTQYSLEDAIGHHWKCPADGGIIKKGVSDRAKELSKGGTAKPRPPYLHVLPLAQIIQTVEGAASPNTKKCRAIYSSFISAFGNEISILIDIPPAEIRTIHPRVADAISALRENRVTLHPGGGGKYGTFSLT